MLYRRRPVTEDDELLGAACRWCRQTFAPGDEVTEAMEGDRQAMHPGCAREAARVQREPHRFPELQAGHPAVGNMCPLCGKVVRVGERPELIPARVPDLPTGGKHAGAVIAHAACARDRGAQLVQPAEVRVRVDRLLLGLDGEQHEVLCATWPHDAVRPEDLVDADGENRAGAVLVDDPDSVAQLRELLDVGQYLVCTGRAWPGGVVDLQLRTAEPAQQITKLLDGAP